MKELFMEHGKMFSYNRGDILFNENEYCERVGFIVSGHIQIVTIAQNEQEVVIGSLGENSLFGDLLVYSSHPYYYGIGIATKQTNILYISKDKLMSLFSENTNSLENFLTTICNKAVGFKQLNKLYAQKSIEQKIIFYFQSLAKDTNSNVIYLKSITNLANILSLPRPSVSRSLHVLEKKKRIKINNKMITLFF